MHTTSSREPRSATSSYLPTVSTMRPSRARLRAAHEAEERARFWRGMCVALLLVLAVSTLSACVQIADLQAVNAELRAGAK